MKKAIFIILSLLGSVGIATGQEENYIDSIFGIELAKEQLKDSTMSDRMYYHLYQGLLYTNTNGQAAINEFLTCITLDSTVMHPEIYSAAAFQLYKICQSNKQYNEAYYFLNQAHRYNPRNTTYLENLAWFELSIQNFKQSIKYFKKINKLSPTNPEYVFGLSQAYLQNKQHKKALNELQKYEQIEGASVQIVSQRAEIWLDAGKPEKAIDETKKYIKDNPIDHMNGSFMLAQLYKYNNRQNERIALLNELNATYPDNTSVLLALADYYKESGDETRQNEYTLRAVSSKSIPAKNISTLVRPIISGMLQEHDHQRVYNILDTLSTIYPEHIDILTLQADAYRAMKDTTALQATLYDLRNKTKNENIDLQLIEIAEQKQNNAEVRRLATEGYDKFKTDRWAYFSIISLAKEEKYDSLLQVGQALLPTIKDKFTKGRIYQLMGDVSSTMEADSVAFAMYDSCLVYDPNNVGALNNLAYNMTRHPGFDINRAERMASKALELEPESTTVLDTYAWILYLRGDYRLAEIYFNKLARIATENHEKPSIEVLYHRGCVSNKTGDRKTAKLLWSEALKIYEENKQENFKETEIIDDIKRLLQDNE